MITDVIRLGVLVYHVPLGKTWNAKLVAEALKCLDLVATVKAEEVVVELLLEEFVDMETLTNAKTAADIKPKIIGCVEATIRYLPNKLLNNLRVDFDRETLLTANSMPDQLPLKSALEECGYICDGEREIVMMYCPQNDRVISLLEQNDELEKRREECLSNREFKQAASLLHKQDRIREEIETAVAKIAE